jgi:hypothetical protein
LKTYKHNSENWYCDIQPLFKRLRRWFVSCGWETPYHSRAGYSYRWAPRPRLSIRARGHRSWAFAVYSSLCPLSLFGGRATFQSFGVNWYSRKVKGYYCLHYDFTGKGKDTRMRWYAYRSHNATPWGADVWYIGAPLDVTRAAQEHHDIKTLEREVREAREKERTA